MNAEFFQSWKGSFLIAAVIVTVIAGYRIATHKDLATRLSDRQIERNFPGGEPAESLRSRVILGNATAMNMNYSLDELVVLFEVGGATVTWQAENETIFIMRTHRVDALTDQTVEFAIRMAAIAPDDLPSGDVAFQLGAIRIVDIALNSEMLDTNAAQTLLFEMGTMIALNRMQAAP